MAQKVCSTCGFVGYAKVVTKGSIIIEIFLWCLLLIPGLLYSLWRLTTRSRNGCPKCGNTTMIPVNTPIGQSLVNTLHQETVTPPKEESTAYKIGAIVGGAKKHNKPQESNDDFVFKEIAGDDLNKDKAVIIALPDDPNRPGVKKAKCGECNKVMTYQSKMVGKDVKCPDCKLEFALP